MVISLLIFTAIPTVLPFFFFAPRFSSSQFLVLTRAHFLNNFLLNFSFNYVLSYCKTNTLFHIIPMCFPSIFPFYVCFKYFSHHWSHLFLFSFFYFNINIKSVTTFYFDSIILTQNINNVFLLVFISSSTTVIQFPSFCCFNLIAMFLSFCQSLNFIDARLVPRC